MNEVSKLTYIISLGVDLGVEEISHKAYFFL